jgi:hypothetical protein
MKEDINAVSSGGEFTTTAPVVVPLLAYGNEPEFWAMPGPGQTLQGLRRGVLYGLWRDGEIQTISVRRKGHSRGRRLIVAESLRNYLRRLQQEQNAGKKLP